MLILGVDTSGKNGSIALVRFAGVNSRTLDVVPLEGGTFSAQLIPQISALLSKHKLTKSDVDAFAVASGPGSFTGLRVGLAAIKALAEVLQKPIAAVSLLELITRAEGHGSTPQSGLRPGGRGEPPVPRESGQVIGALDAGRGEVFVGRYDFENNTASEELLTIPALHAKAGGLSLVTSDQGLADKLITAGLNVTLISWSRADAVAVLGYE